MPARRRAEGMASMMMIDALEAPLLAYRSGLLVCQFHLRPFHFGHAISKANYISKMTTDFFSGRINFANILQLAPCAFTSMP